MSDPVVRWADVAFQYPNSPTFALRPISMEISRGEFVALVGPSGSGKSTMMLILGMLEHPTAGIYEFEGQDVESCSDEALAALRGASIGFVFQRFHLLEHLTIEQNVLLGGRYLTGCPYSEIHDSASDLLEHVGLSDRKKDRPSELSGGERQRVAIARALVGKPTLILADEPTGNLDSATSMRVMRLFQSLRTELGVTLVVVTHNYEIARLAERRLQLADGQLAAD